MVSAVIERSMELNPKQRYQTPGEMLNELTMVQRRMSLPEGSSDAAAVIADLPGKNRSVMIVESNAKLQDALRDQLKRQRLSGACDQRSAAAAGLVCRGKESGRMRALQHRSFGRAIARGLQ